MFDCLSVKLGLASQSRLMEAAENEEEFSSQTEAAKQEVGQEEGEEPERATIPNLQGVETLTKGW